MSCTRSAAVSSEASVQVDLEKCISVAHKLADGAARVTNSYFRYLSPLEDKKTNTLVMELRDCSCIKL